MMCTQMVGGLENPAWVTAVAATILQTVAEDAGLCASVGLAARESRARCDDHRESPNYACRVEAGKAALETLPKMHLLKTLDPAILWLGLIVSRSLEFCSRPTNTSRILYPLLHSFLGDSCFISRLAFPHTKRQPLCGYFTLSWLLFRAGGTLSHSRAFGGHCMARISFFMTALVACLGDGNQSYLRADRTSRASQDRRH